MCSFAAVLLLWWQTTISGCCILILCSVANINNASTHIAPKIFYSEQRKYWMIKQKVLILNFFFCNKISWQSLICLSSCPRLSNSTIIIWIIFSLQSIILFIWRGKTIFKIYCHCIAAKIKWIMMKMSKILDKSEMHLFNYSMNENEFLHWIVWRDSRHPPGCPSLCIS